MSLVAPCEGAETSSSLMGLRPLGEIMSLAVAMDLHLEVVSLPVVGCFFGTINCWRGFLKMGLVRKKFER